MTNIVVASTTELDPHGTRFAVPLVEACERFKGLTLSRVAIGSQWLLGHAPRMTGAGGDGFLSLPNGGFITWAGTWIHPEADPADPVGWLAAAWKLKGAAVLGSELSGQFALFRIAAAGAPLEVVTDRCGSLHVFVRQDANGVAVSTSSAALADERQLNPLSVQEFVATGNVYGDRTLWEGVHKLPPASVVEFRAQGPTSAIRYWKFADLDFRGQSLSASVERLYAAVEGEVRAIARLYPRMLADLTGGYDSRLLLAGLLAAGVEVSTTVSGAENDPDAVVAAALALQLGIPHTRVAPGTPCAYDDFLAAVRLTDAEADAFDYARVARVHGSTAASFSVAVGGSFGEIARGYWWELLWPSIGAQRPLDARLLARARFAGESIDSSVFAKPIKVDIAVHMETVVAAELADKRELPNTAQMDWTYFTVRMQRWQGRLASSTAQLRPCLSPLASGAVLEAMLEASPRARLRSLLVRELFARHQPVLACVPLEHGYPPRPFRWTHAWQHLPLLAHYARRIVTKSLRMMEARLPRKTNLPRGPGVAERYPAVFEPEGKALLSGTELRASGLFDGPALERFLAVDQPRSDARFLQWRRLLTLEQALRIMRAR